MEYFWKTRFLPLMVSIDEEGNAYVYIDGSYAIHADAKSHSGLFLMMGRGAMINASKKLDLVTTSLTEIEIVACGERFPKCTWF